MAQTDFSTGLQNASEIDITVTGRTSGRTHSYYPKYDVAVEIPLK